MIPRAVGPLPPRDRRRRLTLGVLGALAALLVLAPVAAAGVLTPESGGGSPGAAKAATLYKIVFAMGVVIFIGVEGAIIVALVRDRFRRGRPEPEQVRGNRTLEVGWTVGAALLLVVIAVLTFAFLPGIQNPTSSGPGGLQTAGATQDVAAVDQAPPPGGKSLNVNVVGQQYLWRFDYPGPKRVFSYYRMVVPVNTTITMSITSQDVIHSFWVPKLFGKADAVPGYTNHAWFKATKPGLYPGNCAELCGENHAQMRNVVEVMPVDRYQAWYARQAQAIQQSQSALAITRKTGKGPPAAP